MNRKESEILLKKVFGFDIFYDEQWLAIEKILKGERLLLIEKTGYGKSLCYQFPALLFEGLTIVFSPLISLMRDQVNKLKSLGISAELLTHYNSSELNQSILKQAINNELKILYIHPARMENAEWLETTRKINISMIVVDEAHCISTWGHDFIPAYQKIINLVNILPTNFPVLATTATATRRVEKDILEQIGRNISSIRGDLMRPNFHLFVIKVSSEAEKMIWIGKNVNKFEGTGLIYTGTRSDTELYSQWLKYLKINSVHYNAGLEDENRKEIEDGLQNNSYKCIISTNALGMGIDKPDVRFIFHTQIPQSPIHYYQEIGRAGRDGQPAYLILFYNPATDNDLPLSFINNARHNKNKYLRVIESLKSESLGMHDIIKAANLKMTEVKVILSDLTNQKIISKISRHYELNYNAPELDFSQFEELRKLRLSEFDEMTEYANLDSCRMQYLCNYLGDATEESCGNCDIDVNKIIQVKTPPELQANLNDFFENNFPILYISNSRTKLANGVAASLYGKSNVGKIIHQCKYDNGGDYPEKLVELVIKAFRKTILDKDFDLIMFVPPSTSGDLVKNFAHKIAKKLNINITDKLKKARNTEPQKIFGSGIAKSANVKDAFIYENTTEIRGKRILLIDDIYDSGATIKEIGKYLTANGAAEIVPLVIAKTVGGDI